VHDRRGTPIPLELDFPWGRQSFWGDDRVYLWSRGRSGPHAIACGYLALDAWCIAELERNRPVDELIEQIVTGNECIAILGAAVMLALQTDRVSEAVFPLITAQRLWLADEKRFTEDLGGRSASLIGFKGKSDMEHVEAIRAANARPVRKKQLKWLAPRYVLDPTLADRTKAAISDFPNKLPFQYQEQRGVLEWQEYLAKMAKTFAEVADMANYQAYKTEKEDEIAVVHTSPSANTPEAIERATQAKQYLDESALFMWASKTLEGNTIESSKSLAEAIKEAKDIDSSVLFTTSNEGDDLNMRRGAVAGSAAVALRHRDGVSDEDLAWARDVVRRARVTPERFDRWWNSSAIIPWHPCIFAASALADDIRHGTADADAPASLLRLIAHPLEGVSLAALKGAMTLWECDPKLAWAALHVAFQLCLIQPNPPDQPRGPATPTHSEEYIQQVLDAALQYYSQGTGWLPLPPPPPAWVKVPGRKRVRRRRPRIGVDLPPETTEDDWGEPPVIWHSQFAAKIINLIPLPPILDNGMQPNFVDFFATLLTWTIEKNSPPWARDGGYDTDSTRIIEWTTALSNLLGKLWGHLDQQEAEQRFVAPILALEGDPCWAMLAPAVEMFLCVHVYDSDVVPAHAVHVLKACLERFLKASAFKKDAYRAGRFSGFDEPSLARSLMFVSVEHAPLAARLVNGDWSDLPLVMPIVDMFVAEGGWIATAMGHYLTLCERAATAYPAATFANQVLGVLQGNAGALASWHGTMIPARIASMIQTLAHRDAPLPLTVAQRFLRILDYLVDMGDRRSAALQLSETFREIRLD
jgi:hypothetical protein